MHSIRLDWKSHNINLANIEAWIKTNAGEYYAGNSADAHLTLWFSEEPSQEVKDAIQEYWDGLTEESDEATSYKSANEIRDRIKELKEQIPSKTWNQLNTAQRKIVVGIEPTQEDLWA